MSETVAQTAKPPKSSQKESMAKGLALATLAPIAGIALWVLLWRGGFIASIVSFAVAWGAVKLYKIGAGVDLPSRKAALSLAALILVGVVLAFFAGIISDATSFYKEEAQMSELELLQNSQFWSLVWENFKLSEFWSSYTTDILISLAFTALGIFWIIRDLLIPTKS